MATLNIIAGPRGLSIGTELTFFYPSTEWSMAQTFDCFCGTASCRGRIGGAKDMSATQLQGLWLNGYIRDMLEERDAAAAITTTTLKNPTVAAAAAAAAQRNGLELHGNGYVNGEKANGNVNPVVTGDVNGGVEAGQEGAARKGPTSRELSGEMGGDTTAAN